MSSLNRLPHSVLELPKWGGLAIGLKVLEYGAYPGHKGGTSVLAIPEKIVNIIMAWHGIPFLAKWIPPVKVN